MKLKWEGWKKLPNLLERFKYPVLILLAGVALTLWPSRSAKSEAADPVPTDPTSIPEAYDGQSYCEAMERRLEDTLSQIRGAGRVRVMLTLKSGPSARYQTDLSQREEREEGRSVSSSEEKTVMVNRSGAYNEPAVVSTVCPEFQGALIVAEGGGDAGVRYLLCAAVTALLGLGADQITVVKMK